MLQNYSAEIENLISETKYYGHGYWKSEDFMDWADRCLKLIESTEGVKSNNYKIFKKLYGEVSQLSPGYGKFNIDVAKCLSILKRIKKGAMK